MTAVPVTRRVVDRFVAGEGTDDAVAAVTRLRGAGLLASVDHLGEDVADAVSARAAAAAYELLLQQLATSGLAADAEVSIKLSALGGRLPGGRGIALENARGVCAAAAHAGTEVTVDMEDHTTVDTTLATVEALRVDFPRVGVAVQAMLRRTEDDCRELSARGARVRLVKGAYAEPASVAHPSAVEVDRAYVRCLRILMAGSGYPMVATHDPRIIDIAAHLAQGVGRGADGFEFQMLYGVRPEEQRRLAGAGFRMRIYTPYGTDWYGYFMRRLAERPANVMFFLRAVAG